MPEACLCLHARADDEEFASVPESPEELVRPSLLHFARLSHIRKVTKCSPLRLKL